MISVQTEDFDLGREYTDLRQEGGKGSGAIVTFVGLVRDINQDDTIETLFLEHYPGMTENVLADICKQAQARWSIGAINVIHRVGELSPNDQIVYVGVASAHRSEAFAACEFVMDFLKTQAPFWKRETTTSGSRWVAAKESDAGAAQRWSD